MKNNNKIKITLTRDFLLWCVELLELDGSARIKGLSLNDIIKYFE